MFEALTDAEREIVRRAMDAAANGPFFPDWEFQTIFGVDRDEVRNALARWPNLHGEADFLSANNSMLWLVAYPHKLEPVLTKFNLDADELVAVHRRWRKALGMDAKEFFDFIE